MGDQDDTRDPSGVELNGVTVTYQSRHGTVTALESATASFPAGTSTSIVGRSGSGKSTLVSVLGLMRTPTAGSVSIGGVEASTLSEPERARLRARAVGLVFQSFHLERSLTALQNIALPWTFDRHGLSHREAQQRANETMELLGIGELSRRRPFEMSGGQRQRVAIGRALFLRPTVFLADEPTGNLDEETANSVADVILGLPVSLGTAVVVVTHDLSIAERADRQLLLTRGRLDSACCTV